MSNHIYQQLCAEVEFEQTTEEYEEGEMQMISRKIMAYFKQAAEGSQKDASKKIGVCVYLYAEENGLTLSKVPYHGKVDNSVRDITFDLKNIPPTLARLIARMIDETDFEPS